MIKASKELIQVMIDEKNIINPIMKAHTDYVLSITFDNLDKLILGSDEPLAEIMTIEEWYAQVND